MQPNERLESYANGTLPPGAVTEISPLPSDPNQQRVKVDDRIVVRLPRHEVEALGLSPGHTFGPSEAQAVQHIVEITKARKAALTLLGRRSYATSALRARLARRGFSESAVDAVIAEMQDQGWVDDREHARQVAESILRKKPAGRDLLIARLTQREIDPTTAGEVADELLADRDPETELDEFIAQAKERSRSTPREKLAQRLMGQLVRRGYDQELVREALDRAALLPEESC